MAKKKTLTGPKYPTQARQRNATPGEMLEEVLGHLVLTPEEVEEFESGRGDIIAKDHGLEIHVRGFGVGANIGEKLQKLGVAVGHTVYEKGASVWVCLFVKLETLPSRRS